MLGDSYQKVLRAQCLGQVWAAHAKGKPRAAWSQHQPKLARFLTMAARALAGLVFLSGCAELNPHAVSHLPLPGTSQKKKSVPNSKKNRSVQSSRFQTQRPTSKPTYLTRSLPPSASSSLLRRSVKSWASFFRSCTPFVWLHSKDLGIPPSLQRNPQQF